MFLLEINTFSCYCTFLNFTDLLDRYLLKSISVNYQTKTVTHTYIMYSCSQEDQVQLWKCAPHETQRRPQMESPL